MSAEAGPFPADQKLRTTGKITRFRYSVELTYDSPYDAEFSRELVEETLSDGLWGQPSLTYDNLCEIPEETQR